MAALDQKRRYEAGCANDRFLIRKRTFREATMNDGTWSLPDRALQERACGARCSLKGLGGSIAGKINSITGSKIAASDDTPNFRLWLCVTSIAGPNGAAQLYER